MALPVGITTCSLTFGGDVDFAGNPVAVDVVAKPNRDAVWSATGQRILGWSFKASADAGVPGTILLPFVDQAGFVDSSGAPVTMWAYSLTATYKGASTEVVNKTIQPLVGQDVVDIDTLSDGTVITPVTGEIPLVTSVNGETGVVTVTAQPPDPADIQSAVEDYLTANPPSTSVAAADITDATDTGISLIKATDGAAARTAIGAGTSNFDGTYAALTGKPTIPTTPADIGAQPAGSYATTTQLAAKADTAALAPVATSGAYTDLTSKPTLGTAAAAATADFDPAGAASAVAGTAQGYTDSQIAALATVASTGSYNDLIDAPTAPGAVDWADINNKPTTFAPIIGTSAADAKAGDYEPASTDITDATVIGQEILTATDGDTVRSLIGAGSASFTGSYLDLTDVPTTFEPADGSVDDSKVAGNAAISADKIADGTTNKLMTAAEKTAIDSLAPVATSGAYSDLTGSPTLADLGGVPTSRTVAGHALSGNVTLAKADVGLGSVDNTADTAKPVSTAQQSALDLKADSADVPSALTDLSGTLADTQLLAGSVVAVAFTSANYTTLARPTARTDVTVWWKGDATVDSTMIPTDSITGDIVDYNAAA